MRGRSKASGVGPMTVVSLLENTVEIVQGSV